MADLHEARRQDVQTEASHELARTQGHLLLAAMIRATLVAGGNRPPFTIQRSSTRILSQDDPSVTFSFRNAGSEEELAATISGEEFLRRFLQHVLPRGFRRVRSFGWLSPAAKRRFAQVCALLDARYTPKPLRLRIALTRVECPQCKKPMRRLAQTGRAPP